MSFQLNEEVVRVIIDNLEKSNQRLEQKMERHYEKLEQHITRIENDYAKKDDIDKLEKIINSMDDRYVTKIEFKPYRSSRDIFRKVIVTAISGAVVYLLTLYK